MKILIVANSYWNLYNFRKEFIFTLQKSGIDVSLLAPKDEKFSKFFSKESIPCHNLFYSNLKINFFFNLFTLINLYFKIRKVQPDKIIVFTIKINILVSLICFFSEFKLINNITGLGSSMINSKFMKFIVLSLLKFSLKKSSMILFQNNDDKNFFIENNIVNENKTKVIRYFGVNINKYKYSPLPDRDKGLTFIYFGRLIKDKGIFELVDAIKIVKKTYPKTKFKIIGDIDYNNPGYIKKELINEWKNKKLFELNKFQIDISKIIQTSDCVILPSYREGLPKSILESLSIGRPAIVTNVPGCRDLIIDNFNGLICEPKSAKNLSIKILQYINLNKKVRNKMSINARNSVIKDFNSDNIILEYINIIRSI